MKTAQRLNRRRPSDSFCYLIEPLEERLALTIVYTIKPGTTLDVFPLSSIIPAGMDRMEVNLTTVPGVAHGNIFRMSGVTPIPWGSGAPNVFTTGAGNNRITGGEGFRYVNNGTGNGTADTIPVTFRDATGFTTKADTIVINLNANLNPPVINTQPNTFIQIGPGTKATMSVVASGTPAPTYQWYEGIAPDASRPIAGATSATYTTPTLTTIQQYYYFCRIVNSGGYVDTQTVTVQTALATTVTTSNVSAVYSTIAYAMGLNASVSLNGAGQPALNTGNVTFTSLAMGGIFATSATVANGNASAFLSIPAGQGAGNYGLEAHYAAPAGIAESFDNKTITITKANTTTVAANKTANSSGGVLKVGLSAAITSAAGVVKEGTVTFTVLDGATTIGAAVTSDPVAAGAATALYALPANTRAGVYTIKAVHNGSNNYNGSSDTTHTLTVAPVITSSISTILANATTLTINGFGFDAATLANNVVTFPSGVTGTVTAATANTLTISNVTGLVAGSLNLSVSVRSIASTSVQVGNVIPVVTSSTTNINANANTLTLNGFGFSSTIANNFIFHSSGAGNITAASRTQLTLTSLTALKGGPLVASVTSNSQSSGVAVQVANVIPLVNIVTNPLPANATSMTIAGLGFDATTLANNTVTFNNGATGVVTAATATQLTVTPSGLVAGVLNASVSVNGTSSTTIQVGIVTPVITSATTSTNADVTTLTINGFGFSSTAANNSAALSSGTGTVTAASRTQLTLSSVAGIKGGALSVQVTSNGQNSGAPVQIASVAPVITVNTAALPGNATSLTINGFGFDPTAANNVITFAPGITGTVTATTATSITLGNVANLVAGVIPFIVTVGGVSSAFTQVATVYPVITSATANIGAGSTTLTINGFGFTQTIASNALTLSSGAGTITAASRSQLTITGLSGLTGGALMASVVSNVQSSGAPAQVATVVPAITVNTATVLATATTLTIAGVGFDTTLANNVIALPSGVTGTVTAATATQLTLSNVSGLVAGPLLVTVAVRGTVNGPPKQVANIVPVITASSAPIRGAAGTTMTISGFGFSPSPSLNAVTLSPAVAGSVTAATSTQLTYFFLGSAPAGNLSASVTSNVVSSGTPVQVAVVDGTAPTATGGQLNLDGQLMGTVSVQFSEAVDPGMLLSHFIVDSVGGPALRYVPVAVSQDPTSHVATFRFNTTFANANFRATVKSSGLTDLAGNAMAADYGYSFYYLAGDSNRDRTVGFADLVAVAQRYGTTAGGTYATGDVDGDNMIGFSDLVIVAQNYGQSVQIPAAEVAPAPAAATPVVATAVAATKPLATAKPLPPASFSNTRISKPRQDQVWG